MAHSPDETLTRAAMALRIFRALGLVATAAATVSATACGGIAVVDPSDGTGGAGGTGSTSSNGSNGSTSNTTVTTSNSTGTGGLLDCGDPVNPETEFVYLCLPDSNGQGCPAVNEVQSILFQQVTGGDECIGSGSCCHLTNEGCGPDPSVGTQCCYFIGIAFYGCEGRPFVADGEVRTAAVVRRSDWLAAAALPDIAGLDAPTRAALAERFTHAALFEHASIASFARFTLELMGLGAPADLIAAAQQAMGDEVRHAQLCFALASAYTGEPVGPSAIEMGGALDAGRSAAEIAVAVAFEGCINETIAALIVAAERDRAADPAVRAALESIAADEASHAELAWRSLAWLLAVAPAEVASAVEKVFLAPPRFEPRAALAVGAAPGALAAHGWLSVAEQRVIVDRAMREVVLPCARALLSNAASETASAGSTAAVAALDHAAQAACG